jgi:predicted metal-binding protein
MTPATLFVCSLCQFSIPEKTLDGVAGGQHLIGQLQAALAASRLESAVHIQPVRCMAQCGQPCNVTLAAPDKLTFILSGLSPTEAAPALVEFCRQYTEQPDGKVPYRERSPTIHEATAFILPPLPAGS